MNWSRLFHTLGAVAGVVLAIGPQIMPLIPPAWGAGAGVVIALASNLNTILGRQAGQTTDQSKP